MAEQTNLEKIIEELKQDPGRSAKNIGKRLGVAESTAISVISKLAESEEPEIKKLIAKRKAYVEGGSQLAKILKAIPGASYQKITIKLREHTLKDGVRARDMTELFEGLIGYCREEKDTALRETLAAHKKAGGWMPGAGSLDGIRYSEKFMEELRKNPGKANKELGMSLGLSLDSLREVMRKMKESKDPESLMLLAKRELYLEGAAELVERLKASPGASYPEIAGKIAEKTGKRYNIPKLMELLIGYAKKHKDTEVRETILAHKKAGGWMP